MTVQDMAFLPAVIKAGPHNGHRQSSRRRFRRGVCAAALRAFTAAKAYLFGEEDITLEEAAARHGSCIAYVRAAVTLLQSGDQRLIKAVMHGDISISAAAESVEPLVMLLTGYAKASPRVRDDFFVATGCTADLSKLLVTSPPAERTRAAARLDAGVIWDEMVNPLLKAAE
jgi:hypothetical protein